MTFFKLKNLNFSLSRTQTLKCSDLVYRLMALLLFSRFKLNCELLFESKICAHPPILCLSMSTNEFPNTIGMAVAIFMMMMSALTMMMAMTMAMMMTMAMVMTMMTMATFCDKDKSLTPGVHCGQPQGVSGCQGHIRRH